MKYSMNVFWETIDPVKSEMLIRGMRGMQQYGQKDITIYMSNDKQEIIDKNINIQDAIQDAKTAGVHFITRIDEMKIKSDNTQGLLRIAI